MGPKISRGARKLARTPRVIYIYIYVREVKVIFHNYFNFSINCKNENHGGCSNEFALLSPPVPFSSSFSKRQSCIAGSIRIIFFIF